MVEREYSSDSAISQTGRAFRDKIDTNPKKVNSSCKYFEAKGHGVKPTGHAADCTGGADRHRALLMEPGRYRSRQYQSPKIRNIDL
jgi:hypothetical protein